MGFSATRFVTDHWLVNFDAAFNRLLDSAGDSPITQQDRATRICAVNCVHLVALGVSLRPYRQGCLPVDEKQAREKFDTGLSKIRHEIKSRLVDRGFFGSVTNVDLEPTAEGPTGSRIGLIVKGRSAERSFNRAEIEDCRLRVGGAVLSSIIAMVEEVSGQSRSPI